MEEQLREGPGGMVGGAGGEGLFRRVRGPYVPALFGLCFALAFPILFMGRTALGARSLGSASIYVFYTVSIAVHVCVAVRSRRGFSFAGRMPLLAVATAACVTGAVLVMLSIGLPGRVAAGVLFLVGTPLASAGISLLMLAWYEQLARLSIDYAMLYYIAAALVAGLLRLVQFFAPLVSGAAGVVADACICCLPAFAFACFAVGSRKVAGLPYAAGEQVSPRWEFPQQPVLLLVVFYLAAKFSLNLISEDDKGYSAVANIACYGILLAVVVMGFKRFPYRAIRYAVLPLMLAGMLCQLNGPGMAVAGAVATRAAQELLLAFVVSLLFDLSYRRGVNALWVFGLTLACGNAGTLAANLLTVELAGWLAAEGATRLAVSVLIVVVTVAFMALASERNLAGTWGIKPSDAPKGNAHSPSLAELCSRAARLYDLTRREEDVLLMRLEGASLKEVEERLCIAHNTVKSHVRHIYAKLGVTGVEEARAVVEGREHKTEVADTKSTCRTG